MAAPAGASKQDIRERIWDYMESHDLADFPRPVHHRIPNFKGASQAAEHLSHLQAFSKARTVKVNPDAPQRNARFLVLENKKTLLVPTPRLRTGLFNRITPPPGATKDVLRKCATSQGVRNFSVPVGLDASVQVDLVVVGSVAVSEKGWRIGKGEGYADLEYAMMVSMGAVHEGTPVVTIVHDCQVVDIPEALLEDHDLTVDYIITPTRVIATGCARPKPVGIVWSKVSYEMLEKIPILRSLCEREKQAGKDVSLPTEPSSQTPAPRSGRRPWGVPRWQRGSGGRPRSPPKEEGAEMAATVCLGNLPRDARMSELQRALLWLGAAPMSVTRQEAQRRAILHYPDPAAARKAVNCLQGLRLGPNTLKVYWGRRGPRVLVGAPYSKSRGHSPWGF